MTDKSELLHDKVEAIEVTGTRTVSELLELMSKTGFQGRKLANTVELLELMMKDPDVTVLLGYAGSMSTTGQWKLITWLIENGYVDVLIGTGANLSEDIVEAMGHAYYQGSEGEDDKVLFEKGLNRYYDVYGKEDDYLEMTELIAEFILTLDQEHKYSSREFLKLFGDWFGGKGIYSIVTAAAKHDVPVFCPAIIDSPYGDAALIAKSKGHDLCLDGVKEYVEFMKLGEHVKDTGVIYLGGGVPKDFIQLFAVTGDLLYEDLKVPNRQGARSREATDEEYYPHKYAVQITTDSPQWGGLSGCTFDEAVSWGKERDGGHVQCHCDITIALPIICHAMGERLDPRQGRKLDQFC